MVVLVVEGGPQTIRQVYDYVCESPPVPVVVCDGSGRAADLISFIHLAADDEGHVEDHVREQLISLITHTFPTSNANIILTDLLGCVKTPQHRRLITVFRLGKDPHKDIDHSIQSALLKSQERSPAEQLMLSLAWDRVDIAETQIFSHENHWQAGTLEEAMLQALLLDRVQFVRLLLANGVDMGHFLSLSNLHKLYNSQHGHSSLLTALVSSLRGRPVTDQRLSLIEVGGIINRLMGGAYRSTYSLKSFRACYAHAMEDYSSGKGEAKVPVSTKTFLLSPSLPYDPTTDQFKHPFHELMVWAILMKRQEMAKFMWHQGEEALAKALVACKLYKSMSKAVEEDHLSSDLYEDILGYSDEFAQLALELLDYSYGQDAHATTRLLTYELVFWGRQTCLSLAYSANHRDFISHSCCQALLNEMWMGGLRMRKYTNIKLLLSVFIPPFCLFMEYRSREELQLMPQTAEERMKDVEVFSRIQHSMLGEVKQEVEREILMETQDMNYEQDVEDDVYTMLDVPAPRMPARSFSVKMRKPKRAINELTMWQRVYEFYTAPITKYTSHAFKPTLYILTTLRCISYCS